MRKIAGVAILMIILGASLTYAAGPSALFGSGPATRSQVEDVVSSSGSSHVWDFELPTGAAQVWLHPDPQDSVDPWDFDVPTETPQVWLHPDPPETEDLWDFDVPTGTPQVWLHPDPHEPVDLWDFDVPTDIPHVW